MGAYTPRSDMALTRATRGAAAREALHRKPGIDRSGDRLVALWSIVIALAFLAAALGALVLRIDEPRGLWLPLHLVLAGAAATAIAGVMPFFVAAFAAARPASTLIRGSAVIGVAAGAACASGGVAGGRADLGVVGATLFVGGLVATAVAATAPLRGALGASRGIVVQAYLLALAAAATAVTGAFLYLAGWPPVVEAWGQVKAAHAWLNLFGFVSLTIAATLLHFFPTVMGARIQSTASARSTIGCLALGSLLAAGGLALGWDIAARLGAGVTLLSPVALISYGVTIVRSRARWSTDVGWHRFAMGGLASAMWWFLVGVAIAVAGVLLFGSSPPGWSTERVVAPLVGGWILLALLASATHLLPAVGPGTHASHRRQRELLGRAAFRRLLAANAGIVLLSVATPLGFGPGVTGGLVLLGAPFVVTAALLGGAVVVAVRAQG